MMNRWKQTGYYTSMHHILCTRSMSLSLFFIHIKINSVATSKLQHNVSAKTFTNIKRAKSHQRLFVFTRLISSFLNIDQKQIKPNPTCEINHTRFTLSK